MPGEGMKEPSRKMTRMPRVKRSLFLKSGVLKALRIAPIKRPPRWRMKSQSRGRDLANETNTSKTLSGYDPQVETDEGRRQLGSGRPPGTAGRGRDTQKGAVTEVTAPFVLKPRSRSAGAYQASVAHPPVGNRVDSLSRLTTWNGTFVGFLNPRSFGRRMCIGVWPPSKPCGTW